MTTTMMASARRRSRPGWRSRFRKRGSTSISPRCVFGQTLINHTSAIGPKIFQLFAPVTKKNLEGKSTKVHLIQHNLLRCKLWRPESGLRCGGGLKRKLKVTEACDSGEG